ncbi:MAG: glycosyl hydrolase family 8 [Rhizobium rhizophilum]|uniref:glycosyl hydrolase family 8 n=1 Tax=Rhizobium rhizophilum TaxID=1850373 RepID=UPI0039190744
MRTRLLILTCLLSGALIAGATTAVLSQQEDNVAADITAGAWLVYRHNFVTDEGRVVDNRAGGISHSESQGYGMLMAEAADDRDSFDRIWAWTKVNLFVREDGLAAWRWDPAQIPPITDRNNATDGDLLIAWALMRAGQRWNEPDLQREARRISEAIVEHATIKTGHGLVLLPGVQGFGPDEQTDGPVVNMAYWIFPALIDLGRLSSRFPAKALMGSGVTLLRDARFGTARLPSDWLSLSGDMPRPASGYPSQFGYDAIRVPLYLAWYSRDYPDILEIFASHWKQFGTASMSVVELATATRIAPMPDPGYQAVAALVECSLGRRPDLALLSDFSSQDYYPATLHVLSLMAIAERYPTCLTDFP